MPPTKPSADRGASNCKVLEVDDYQVLCSSPKIVRALHLYRARPTASRLDIWPPAIVYAALGAASGSPSKRPFASSSISARTRVSRPGTPGVSQRRLRRQDPPESLLLKKHRVWKLNWLLLMAWSLIEDI